MGQGGSLGAGGLRTKCMQNAEGGQEMWKKELSRSNPKACLPDWTADVLPDPSFWRGGECLGAGRPAACREPSCAADSKGRLRVLPRAGVNRPSFPSPKLTSSTFPWLLGGPPALCQGLLLEVLSPGGAQPQDSGLPLGPR